VVEGSTSLDHSFLIKGISSLEVAKENDLVFLFDPEETSVFEPTSKEKIKKSNAGIIVASKPVVEGKHYLIVKDPLEALRKIEFFIKNRKNKQGPTIADTAVIGQFAVIEDDVDIGACTVVEDDAKIGCGTRIGAQVFVGRESQIGCNVVIHPGVKILERSIIGDGSIIHSGVVIGSDGFGYRVMGTGLKKVSHVGVVRIGKSVEIGANSTIDRSVFDETVIEDGVKIDNSVHIAHNVKIGRGTAILAHTAIAGSVSIGVGCQIGGQVAIKDHIKIGDFAKIVSKSAVMKNILEGEVVCGVPSMPFSQWKRTVIILQKLPEFIGPLKKMKEYVDGRGKRGFWSKLFKK
jgi:UDP-3-O-[3-hydroxymyristoyl] glucosamine N-acyltransferase